MTTYENDLVIASEAGFAAASGRTSMFTAMCDQAGANQVGADLSCPICHNVEVDCLELVEDGMAKCAKCGALYEVEVTPEIRDYRLVPDFDPDSEREAERVCVTSY